MNKLTIALAIAAATALAGCGRHDNGDAANTASSSSAASSIPGSGNSSSTTIASNAPATTAPADTSTTASTAPAAADSSMGAATASASGSGAAPSSSDMSASAGNTAAMGAGPDAGKATFEKTCQVCHGAGVAGAPKLGDKADWGPRIAQGKDTLYAHALQGFTGKKGMMPPKGGNTALPDADVKAAVDYMVAQAK